MSGTDLRREIACFALSCSGCGSGSVAPPIELARKIEAGHYVCVQCGQREPTELAYVAAQQRFPFVNAPLVAHRSEVGVATVKIGREHTIRVSEDLKVLDWVTASANAEFPATVAVVNRSRDSFTVVVGTSAEPLSESVRVAWSAVGTDEPNRCFFLEALSRSMQALHRVPLTTDQDLRVALVEAVTAYEIFLAWFLREVVWQHPHFQESATKGKAVGDMIRDAGVLNLTAVVLRVAYQNYDPYRIFRMLQLQTLGGVLTVENTMAEMLAGIRLRNRVVHQGATGIDRATVERTVAAAYRLMEIGILNASTSRLKKVVMGFRPPAPHENGPVWPVLFRTVTAIF